MDDKDELVVDGLTKIVNGKVLISDISFTLKPGEIMGLLGPNGAGKTTIIRSLIGLVKTQKGTVMIGEHSLNKNFVEVMSEVGAIVETPEFYNYLTGMQNLQLFARMARREIPKEEIERVLQEVQLVGREKMKVKYYSLGMRQRLGIAQAILHQPAFLLLDEPMNGLDPTGMHEFRELMKKLAQNGTGILISTHILGDLEVLADHLLVLQKGVTTYKGTLDQLAEGKSTLVIETDGQNEVIEILNEMQIKFVVDGMKIKIESDNVQDDEEFRQILLKKFVLSGIKINSFTLEKPSLEEKFLALIEGEQKNV